MGGCGCIGKPITLRFCCWRHRPERSILIEALLGAAWARYSDPSTERRSFFRACCAAGPSPPAAGSLPPEPPPEPPPPEDPTMPRELITVSVGQAGNQIGHRFWELAVREHAAANSDGLFDDAMSSFFRHVDSRGDPVGQAPLGSATRLAPGAGGRGRANDSSSALTGRAAQPIQALRARAVLVDMEEGVVGSVLRGPLGELFESRQLLTDVSGAGNNWAHGFAFYGPQYHDRLSDAFRAQAESCDSLQGFMLTHSLGGGTGSGVGSYILQMLEDEYPEAQRLALSVFPSPSTDDVVTSPYNALLSLSRLAEHADCVFPVENEALLGICSRLQGGAAAGPGRSAAAVKPGSGVDAGGKSGTYDAMNSVAANMLLNLTASVRFEGPLNLDLSEVATNLVPFPRLHFLLSSMSPLAAPRDVGRFGPAGRGAAAGGAASRGVEQAFLDVIQPAHQLVSLKPKQHTYLACGLVVRGGGTTATDLPRSIDRLSRQIRLAPWNPEAFKTAICSQPPVGLPFSLLCLANNCGIATTFAGLHARFQQLYRRRLYTHHYEQYIELSELEAAGEAAAWLADSYRQLDDTSRPPDLARLRPQERGGSSFGQNSLRPEQPREHPAAPVAAAAGQWQR